jgi:hypothetical protein
MEMINMFLPINKMIIEEIFNKKIDNHRNKSPIRCKNNILCGGNYNELNGEQKPSCILEKLEFATIPGM